MGQAQDCLATRSMRFLKKRPRSYCEVVQSICCTCRYVFEVPQYKDGDVYYCTFRAPPRPRCGTLFLKGEEWGNSVKSFEKGKAAWGAWQRKREVMSFGCCENYRMAKPSDGESIG